MFTLYTTDDGRQLPVEIMPCSAMKPQIGRALYMDGGMLKEASGAKLAQYICAEERAESVTAGEMVEVVKIQPDQVWRTTKDTAATMNVGTAYDVASGGMEVDADGTTAANFMVTAIESQTSGGLVFGRFIK